MESQDNRMSMLDFTSISIVSLSDGSTEEAVQRFGSTCRLPESLFCLGLSYPRPALVLLKECVNNFMLNFLEITRFLLFLEV